MSIPEELKNFFRVNYTDLFYRDKSVLDTHDFYKINDDKFTEYTSKYNIFRCSKCLKLAGEIIWGRGKYMPRWDPLTCDEIVIKELLE